MTARGKEALEPLLHQRTMPTRLNAIEPVLDLLPSKSARQLELGQAGEQTRAPTR